ncbi:MAG: S9 family peptidase, partial [Acidobacteriota bacterium]
MARRLPKTLSAHGRARADDYYWMRERDDPQVIAYLEAENAYTEAMTSHTKPLEDRLYEEIKGRIKQTDMSVPYRYDGFFYYSRFEDGRAYPIHCRKEGSLDSSEQILLDVNQLAEGHAFYSVGRRAVSPGRNILAYAVDLAGRRIHTVYFKDLDSGELLEDVIPDVAANFSWANDNRTLFYTKQDPETLRWHRVYRHVLGSDPAEDVLVYEEADEAFATFVFKSKSRRFLVIGSTQTVTTEYRLNEADEPDGRFRVVLPRRAGHEYHVDHLDDALFLRTNDGAENFRLVRAPLDKHEQPHWEDVTPARDDVFLETFELFRDHLVLVERRDGLIQMRIEPWLGATGHWLDFGEPAYTAYVHMNPELDTALLRYGYTSLTTPNSVFDYDMNTRSKTLLKQEEVLGDFEASRYVTERLHATAGDGSRVPISLVYRQDQRQAGGNPALVYGYGAYGLSVDPVFRPSRISLLDRGFVFAIAHVRGGQELGRRWYDGGRLLNKKNTFTDFISCAEHLVSSGHADPARLFAMGGSAGGLLIGAVINMRPDLFKGAIA